MTQPETIVVQGRDGRTERVALEGDRLSVGRHRDNDLCFPADPSLSRHHFVLEKVDGHWMIRDRGSKNGTRVNGKLIHTLHELRPGDRITAGELVVIFGDEDSRKTQIEFYPEGPDAPLSQRTMVTHLASLISGESPVITSGKPHEEPTPVSGTPLLAQPAVAALMKAGRELLARRPLDEMFQLILRLAIDAVGAERGIVLVREGDGLEPRAVHGEGFRISSRVRDQVLEEGVSVLVPDTISDAAFRSRQSISEQQIRSMMAVPLQTETKVLGLVYVDSRHMVRRFTPQDLELLTILANHAAMHVENQRLAEVERMEQLMARELEQAATIQRGLLPDQPPQVPGLDIAGHNAPCRTVGGDYYDYFLREDGGVGITVADVAGKGMPASLLMSNLQACVQTLATEPRDVGDVLRRLNRIVCRRCPSNRFISLFLVLFDPETGSFTYGNAGHNPPMLLRADGRLELLEGSGPVLGILDGVPFEAREDRLGPGDVLLIFTDGVTEAESPAGEEFGETRLADRLRSLREAPAEEIVAGVLDAVDVWSRGAPPADDVTVVAVRRPAR